MALAETVIGIFGKTSAGTPAFTTEAFTPPANSLLVVRVYLMRNTGESEIGLPTISGGSLVWTARGGANTVLKPAWSTRATWFTAPVGGSPASMSITVDDLNNLNIFEYVVSVIAYTGYDTTTPIGGIAGSSTTNVLDGEDSRELSEAPRTEDITLLAIDVDATVGPPKPSLETGWTSVHEKSGGESGIAIAKRVSSTSKTVKTKDVYANSGTFGKGGVGAMVIRAGATVTDLAGNLAGAGVLSGLLTTVANLAGSLVGAGTINGELRTIANLQGTAAGAGVLNGQLVTVASLGAALQGAGTLAGELRLLASLAASMTGSGAIAGELRAVATMAAHLEGTGDLDATLTDVASLAAALSGSGSLVGLFEIVLGQHLVLPTRAAIVPSRASAARVLRRASSAAVRSSRATLAAVIPSRTSSAAVAAAGARARARANPSSAARAARQGTRTKLHR